MSVLCSDLMDTYVGVNEHIICLILVYTYLFNFLIYSIEVVIFISLATLCYVCARFLVLFSIFVAYASLGFNDFTGFYLFICFFQDPRFGWLSSEVFSYLCPRLSMPFFIYSPASLHLPLPSYSNIHCF